MEQRERLEWLQIDSLDLEARGVGRSENGKVVFVANALPGERVQASISRSKRNWESGTAVAWATVANSRVAPKCPHFGVCGGCSMQHVDPAAQLAFKQRILEDDFWHLSRLKPQTLLRPIAGPSWGYRTRARFTVRLVVKKGGILVGFHEKGSSYVADMRSCAIVPSHVSDLLLPLRELVQSLSRPDRAPQIELAMGDSVIALVLRHLEPLTDTDRQRLRDFGARHSVQWWLQAKGPDSVVLLDHDAQQLSYDLPEFGITMPFRPTDFTQVNPQINRVMVARALRLLKARPTDRVIDWFCGLGNFTLPIATQVRKVLGVEGSATLVARALDNAMRNDLQDKVTFTARNLFEMDAADLRAYGEADLWLVDPPRDGALALCKALVEAVGGTLSTKADVHEAEDFPSKDDEELAPFTPPRRIVYVSCNPATLARDAGLLVHHGGYTLRAAGVMNMFPHTAHVESMAVFERD